MSRKELLELLQQRCAELGVDLRFSTAGARRRRTQPGLRPGARRRRPELRRPLPLRRRLPAQPGRPQDQVHVARHRPGLRGVQVLRQGHRARHHADPRLPLLGRGQHLHRRDARGRLAQRRLRRHRAPGVPARGQRRGGRGRASARSSPRSSRATRSWSTTPSGSTSPRSATSAGATTTSCCSATPPTPRTSRSAPAPSWPWRTRSRWPPACTSTPTLEAALEAYETERRPVVESTQRAAQASLEWFENIGMYTDQDPAQFCFNLLTRSRRITYDNLKLRDPEFAARVDADSPATQGIAGSAPAMFQPFRIGALELKNRIVVSPMDMYSAIDGVPGNFHLVHLGSKALGGAGLVMTEMVCVSPRRPDHARAAPASTPTPSSESWREIVDFVHSRSTAAKIGVQLGHSGRKGSTKLMWEGIDEPLRGRLGVVGPSALPYGPGSHVAARDHPRRHGPGPRRVRCRHRPRGRGRLRPARAALRARLPALVVPLAAGQPAHRRIRRIAGEPAALPAGGVRRRARRLARGQADDRAHLRDRLGARRQHRARRRRDRPGVRRARRRRDRRLLRPGRPRTRSPRSAAATRPRSPTGSATRWRPRRAWR